MTFDFENRIVFLYFISPHFPNEIIQQIRFSSAHKAFKKLAKTQF